MSCNVYNSSTKQLTTIAGAQNGSALDTRVTAIESVIPSDASDQNKLVAENSLGTASAKDSTDVVRVGSHDLVESNAVANAINQALSSIYVPRGSLSCAELTSALLIEANVGNVYEMSDSGTTSALFIQGAGTTISVGDNVGIIKAGQSTYMFNYMGNAFDLTDYQKKDLDTPITIGGTSQTTVEGALGGLNSVKADKSETYILYYPSFELYNSWAEFLELLHQQGNGRYCGKAYLDSKWWSYIATITIQTNQWNGTALFMREVDGAIQEAFKPTSNTNTWTVKDLTPTSTVTSGSTAPVQSSAVWDAIHQEVVSQCQYVNGRTFTIDISPLSIKQYGSYEINIVASYTSSGSVTICKVIGVATGVNSYTLVEGTNLFEIWKKTGTALPTFTVSGDGTKLTSLTCTLADASGSWNTASICVRRVASPL